MSADGITPFKRMKSELGYHIRTAIALHYALRDDPEQRSASIDRQIHEAALAVQRIASEAFDAMHDAARQVESLTAERNAALSIIADVEDVVPTLRKIYSPDSASSAEERRVIDAAEELIAQALAGGPR